MVEKISCILMILLLLSSCQTLDKKSSLKEPKVNLKFDEMRDSGCLPDWFFKPSPGSTIGSLGMSRTVSAGGNPDEYAREYALSGLLDYYEIECSSEDKSYKDLISGKVSEASIKGQKFSIPNILRCKDFIIARAVSGSADSGNPVEGVGNISPFDCKPRWICSPASGETGGVLGVSYRAVSPQRQYELAVSNGLLLMKYAYGVDVKGSEKIRRIRSGTGVVRLRRNNMSLRVLGNANRVRLYVKEVRYVGETLYLWLVSPDLPRFETDDSWIRGEISAGVVGSSRKTVSNLLSAQIENAVEKAIVNLAKSGAVSVDVEEFYKKSTYSSLFDQLVESSVNTKVFPSLRGFYLGRDDQVQVWLVPK